MKILLTSGGTKIPIDEVRHIANMSSGTFGTKIGIECLNRGHDLYFMASKDSKTPTKFTYDFNKNSREFITTEVIKNAIWHESISSRYAEITYTSFDDYMETLKDSIEIASLDAIIWEDDPVKFPFPDGDIGISEGANIKKPKKFDGHITLIIDFDC